MNRPLLTLSLLALAALTATAGPRSRQQALQIAQEQAARSGATVSTAEVRKAKSAAATTAQEPYYVFNNAGSAGYTIVSADDELPAIVGYATTGAYDESTMPDGLKAFLNTYAAFTEALQSGDATAAAMAREAAALKASSSYQPVTVAPLLGSICWNQDAPYNNLCPPLNAKGDSVCAVGCVATAMAQVIAYNRWPEHQMAAFPAYTSMGKSKNAPFITEMPAIENTQQQYDYDNMLPTYRKGFYTQEQADAVALLSYHCGRAVMMKYGEESTSDVFRNNLSDYFGYDKNDLSHLFRKHYTQEQWQTIIDRELTAGRAILIGGSSGSGGGHEFVLDGADGNGLYHINWGWNGSDNGYFDLSILNPDKGGIGSGSASDGYLKNTDIIIGIQKPGTAVIDPVIEPIVAESEVPGTDAITWTKTQRASANDAFEGKFKIIYYANPYHHAFQGYVGLRVTADTGEQDVLTDSVQYTLAPGGLQVTSTTNLYAQWPAGRYEFDPVYSFDLKTWYLCDPEIGTRAFVLTDTEILSEDDAPSAYTATLTPDDNLLCFADNAFTLTVTNTTPLEQRGTFTLFVSHGDEDSETEESAGKAHLYLAPNGTATHTFTYRPYDTGDHYASVWSPDNHYIIYRQKFTVTANNGYSIDVNLESLTSSASTDLETTDAYYKGVRVKAPIAYDGTVTFTARVTNTGERAYKGTLNFNIDDCRGTTLAYQGNKKAALFIEAGQTKDISTTYTPDPQAGISSVLCTLSGISVPTTTWTLPAVSPSDTGATLTDAQRVVYLSQQSSGIETVTAPATTAQGIYTLSGQRLERITRPGLYIIDGKKQAVK